MGSKPSKGSGNLSAQLEASELIYPEDNVADADEDGDESSNTGKITVQTLRNTSRSEILLTIENYMETLCNADIFVEKDILPILRYFLQLYMALRLSRRDDLKEGCKVMVDKGLLRYFVELWDEYHSNNDEFYENAKSTKFQVLKMIKLVLMNFSDKCPDLSQALYRDKEVLARITRELTFPELDIAELKRSVKKRYVMQYNLGILINTLRHCDKVKEMIREDNGLENILKYSQSSYLLIKVKVFIILAYCVNDEENDKISTSLGVVKFLLKILGAAISSPHHVSKRYGFSVEETLLALNKLGKNDQNKVNMVEAGVMSHYVSLLNDNEITTDEERFQVVIGIWTLAFHPENRKKGIFNESLVDRLKCLQAESEKSGNMSMYQACSSALFVIGIESHKGQRMDKGHVMISYNWEVQPSMLKLRDYLTQKGCEVWIDVDKMQDSILESMAQAVENSAIVLIAMTEAYKNSNSCRTEAEYAYKRAVPVIPLLVQRNYVADGWLGAMVGMKLFVDLSGDEFEDNFAKVENKVQTMLTNRLDGSGGISRKEQIKGSGTRPPNLSTNMRNDIALASLTMSCVEWTKEDVKNWLNNLGISDAQRIPIVDGKSLAQLCKMLLRSPDCFYKTLQKSLALGIEDTLALTAAIESIISQSC